MNIIPNNIRTYITDIAWTSYQTNGSKDEQFSILSTVLYICYRTIIVYFTLIERFRFLRCMNLSIWCGSMFPWRMKHCVFYFTGAIVFSMSQEPLCFLCYRNNCIFYVSRIKIECHNPSWNNAALNHDRIPESIMKQCYTESQ
jgi:hypothetical protein